MISETILDKDKIDNYNKYPFNMPVVKDFEKLILNSPVTFFVGENGVRKSAFIKAIAVNLGLPKEGGTENFMYETNDTTSDLRDYLKIKIDNKTKTEFFLRAESFYNILLKLKDLSKKMTFIVYLSRMVETCMNAHIKAFLKLVQKRLLKMAYIS